MRRGASLTGGSDGETEFVNPSWGSKAPYNVKKAKGCMKAACMS